MKAIIDYIAIHQYLESNTKPILDRFSLEWISRSDTESYLIKGQKSIKITYNPKSRKFTLEGSIMYFMQGHNLTFDRDLFINGIEHIGKLCGINLFDSVVDAFEYGVIIHTDKTPKEIIANHNGGNGLIEFASPKYKGYFKYFEDSSVRIKMYDVGRNPINKLGRSITEIVSEIGWHPKHNHLRIEVHYKQAHNTYYGLLLKDIITQEWQELFSQDLIRQYKRLQPRKSITRPSQKTDLLPINLILFKYIECLINKNKTKDDIKRDLYNDINSYPDEVLSKSDKDYRKLQLSKFLDKVIVDNTSAWDLSEKLAKLTEITTNVQQSI